ncbi:MAG: DEAD/DEAH box helicase [Candidatus Nanohaloarchaea archaeon]
MELLKQDKLESRTYQEVIAASSLKQNTMIVLPTGLGKTVIAAMIASRKLKDGKVMFLAPTKPLAEQHFKSFNEFIDIDEDEMQVMTGETRPEKRYDLWKEKRVFFGTPQVVENDLIAGEVPVRDFELVLFDECHRATGEYSYVFISEKMPCHKVGLTASPGGDKEKIMRVAENLELSNFEVRTEDDPDVEPYIQDKEVDWMKVSLNNRFDTARKKMEDAKRKPLKELKKMEYISSLNISKTDLLKLQSEIRSKLSTSDDPKHYSAISHAASALKISQAIELLETQGVSQCYSYMRGLEEDSSKAAKKALNDKDFKKAKSLVEYLKKKGEEHPKIEKLVELLEEFDGRAIVFTEYRASADKIVEELSANHNPVKFVGQQGEDGMTQKQQIDTLGEFEEDKYDILVSTSIGEEGLDIPSVDRVIFYEPVPSSVRDIQRMGRTGRQEAGKVTVLIAEDTRDEGYYWSAYHEKNRMNSILEELKEEGLGNQQRSLDSFQEEEEKSKVEIIADDRENRIAKEFSRKEIDVAKERLEVADFVLSEDVAVERKTSQDFVDSIVDNRLFDQLQDLNSYNNPIILIEGGNIYSKRNVSEKAIRGALSSVILDYNIPIIWSQGVDDTVEILVQIAEKEQEENKKEVAVRGNSSGKTMQQRKEFIVAGLPGINTKIARRLLREFKTVRNIFEASNGELQEVEGLGPKKAESITSMLDEQYE